MINPVLIKQRPWYERWSRFFRSGLRRSKRLHLEETLSLGDRRFIALVVFEGSRFLVGGTSSSLSLLARLEQNSRWEPKESSPESGSGAAQ